MKRRSFFGWLAVAPLAVAAAVKAQGEPIPVQYFEHGVVPNPLWEGNYDGAPLFGNEHLESMDTLENRRYPKVINAARRLKQAMWKTMGNDCDEMLARGLPRGTTTAEELTFRVRGHRAEDGPLTIRLNYDA